VILKMEEIEIELFGRVQGVGFRHFIREQAGKLGVRGFVRNRSEGSVLIVAQGEKEKLEVFLYNVQKGPRLSKVEGVSYFWRKAGKSYESFEVALDMNFVKDQTRNLVTLGKRVLNIKRAVPRHVAIIPDGNRRWARAKGLKASEGHRKAGSMEHLTGLINEAQKLGVEYITFWFFSTENWKRDSKELKVLFDLISKGLKELEKEAIKNKVRFRHLGRKDRLPKELLKVIEQAEKSTKNFDKYNLQLCLDYGGRDEIARAMNKMLKSGMQEIKEEDIERYLDSNGIPDPDLIIRTSGERRMSGFMPFQGTYSEFYFADLHFPDFGPQELRRAVEEFSARRRRFGGG